MGKGRRNADIDKAMEELRYNEERKIEIPFKFQYELQKLIKKHDLGDITKVPDFITANFLVGCLREMQISFLNYIGCACAEKMRANGEFYCGIKGYPPNRKKFPPTKPKTRVILSAITRK